MKLVIYVLCYDDASEEGAKDHFGKFPWARVLRLRDDPKASKYMEGAVFLGPLQQRRPEWEDADFVGTMAWKANSKIHIPEDLEAHLERAKPADVVTFLPSTESVVKHAVSCHPRFLEVWVPLLQHLGYDAQETVRHEMPSFFCNYWVATPGWMDRFTDFFALAVGHTEELPGIQEALWSDACYRTHLTAQRCMEIYNKPYIPYHPFVCERLACFFFWRQGAKIVLMSLGKSEFWHKHYMAEMEDVQVRAQHMAQVFHLHHT